MAKAYVRGPPAARRERTPRRHRLGQAREDHTHYHSARLKQHGLAHVRDSVALWTQATPAEVDEYRRFIITLAGKVAAHREHGQAVSASEQEAINEITAALGLKGGSGDSIEVRCSVQPDNAAEPRPVEGEQVVRRTTSPWKRSVWSSQSAHAGGGRGTRWVRPAVPTPFRTAVSAACGPRSGIKHIGEPGEPDHLDSGRAARRSARGHRRPAELVEAGQEPCRRRSDEWLRHRFGSPRSA